MGGEARVGGRAGEEVTAAGFRERGRDAGRSLEQQQGLVVAGVVRIARPDDGREVCGQRWVRAVRDDLVVAVANDAYRAADARAARAFDG